MKKIVIFSILQIGLLQISAQKDSSAAKSEKVDDLSKFSTMDVYGAIPVKYCGGGFGFNALSGGKKLSPFSQFPIVARLGGEFYWAETKHKYFYNIPLTSPVPGDAKIRLNNSVWGINALSRFSMDWPKKFSPYIDVFGGLRVFNDNMDITPNNVTIGQQKNTSQSISSMAQLNYGLTGGVMFSLGKFAKLNLGIMYSHSDNQGKITDLGSTYSEGGRIVTNNTLSPKDMWIAKIGFTFLVRSNTNYNKNCNCRSRSRFFIGGGRIGGGGLSPNRISIGPKIIMR